MHQATATPDIGCYNSPVIARLLDNVQRWSHALT
jgi:hypothetical protein